MNIEWRKWKDVTDECLRVANSRYAYVVIVASVDCGGIDSMPEVHDVVIRDGKTVRPSIAPDTRVYLLDPFAPEPLAWPLPVGDDAVLRIARERVAEAEEDVENAKAGVANAVKTHAEAEQELAKARAELAALLARKG